MPAAVTPELSRVIVLPAEGDADKDVALIVHPPIFPVPSFANSNLGAVTPFA